jgi:hypothetical protein
MFSPDLKNAVRFLISPSSYVLNFGKKELEPQRQEDTLTRFYG